MDTNKINDNFSRDLLCLKLQLETLFENVGGDECVNFLNLVSKFSDIEREVLFTTLNKVVQKLLTNTQRKKSLKDIASEKFENDLYEGIVEEFNNIQVNALPVTSTHSRFKVVNGGKSKAKRKVIRFNEFI